MQFVLFLALVASIVSPIEKFEDGSFLLTGCQKGHICERGSTETSYTLTDKTFDNGMTIVLLCENGQPCETSAAHSTYILEDGTRIEITRP